MLPARFTNCGVAAVVLISIRLIMEFGFNNIDRLAIMANCSEVSPAANILIAVAPSSKGRLWTELDYIDRCRLIDRHCLLVDRICSRDHVHLKPIGKPTNPVQRAIVLMEM